MSELYKVTMCTWITGTLASSSFNIWKAVKQQHVVQQGRSESCVLEVCVTKVLKRGESTFRRSGNVMLLWYWDKKKVYFLSIIHQMEPGRTGKKNKQKEDIIKPVLVNHYNRFMCGIDRNDAMIGNYSSARKGMKWTTKLAFHFIEEALLNSFILFSKVIGKKHSLQFKLLLICQMLGDVTMEQNFQSLHNAGWHFLEFLPLTDKKEKPQKRCVVCTKEKKRKESRYQCKTCYTNMHVFGRSEEKPMVAHCKNEGRKYTSPALRGFRWFANFIMCLSTQV